MLYNLKILNGSITPVFDSNIYNYEVKVSDTAISLVIEYDTDENNTVTVYGNDNLVNGENHVLLEVYDGSKLNTYNLTVLKGLENASIQNNSYAKVEITGKKYDNSIIQYSIIIGAVVMVLLIYKLIFNLHK